jgi:hypothetical protein
LYAGSRKNNRTQRTEGKGIVSSEVRSYANHPFFVKKAEEARETIKRVGLPGDKKK